MADKDGKTDAKNFSEDVPIESKKFFLKGSHSLDWGMQSRLARIFNYQSGRTVMLAFDHGYFLGPTSGIERMDLAINPLVTYVDALMCTRGALRTTIPAECAKPVVLRSSAGSSILKDLSNETVGVAIEDAVRLNASAITCQVFVGGACEHNTIANLVKLIDSGMNVGIPTLAVTAVGKDLVRDARYLGLATRMCAEIGAHFVKTYYCEEGFEQVVAGCPIPIVIAGGKKLPELDALTMAYKAIQAGACGVDMGRNIFLSDCPIGMLKAVRGVVHHDLKPQEALEIYQGVKAEGRSKIEGGRSKAKKQKR